MMGRHDEARERLEEREYRFNDLGFDPDAWKYRWNPPCASTGKDNDAET